MAALSEWDVLECACLHQQVVERVVCSHLPRHMDLADAVLRFLGSTDPVTTKAVRAACAGRHLPGGAGPAYRGIRFLRP